MASSVILHVLMLIHTTIPFHGESEQALRLRSQAAICASPEVTLIIISISNCRDDEVCCTETGIGVQYVDMCDAQNRISEDGACDQNLGWHLIPHRRRMCDLQLPQKYLF